MSTGPGRGRTGLRGTRPAEWPGPGPAPQPQIIGNMPYFWWEPAYRAGIGRMRAAEWTWAEIAEYMEVDAAAAEAAWGCAADES